MKPEHRKRFLFLFFAVLIINFVIYSPCINAYFVNDDYNWIKQVSFFEVVSSFWGGWGHGALFRPLTRLFLYIEFLLFGQSPAGYHLVSFFLQSSLIFIFYLLLSILFKEKASPLFLLPLVIFFYPHHEVVCWISAQTILLSANFIFLSVLSFVLSFAGASPKRFYFLSLLFYVLGLLTYEASVIVPLLCFFAVMVKHNGRAKGLNLVVIKIIPYLVLVLFYFLYRWIVLAGLPEANELTVNPVNWLESFLKLLKFQFIENIFLLVLFLLGAVYFVLLKKEISYLRFSVLWFLICYIPFLIINGYTGRFAYLSMFGIVSLIGFVFKDLYDDYKRYRIVILIVFLAYISFNAVKLYQNAGYWNEAGEISRTIPLQLKTLHAGFPENSTLIFFDIPLGYQESGVFLTYFEEAVQRQYNEKLNIIHVAHLLNKSFNDSLYWGKPNIYRFKYFLESRQLVEIKLVLDKPHPYPSPIRRWE